MIASGKLRDALRGSKVHRALGGPGDVARSQPLEFYVGNKKYMWSTVEPGPFGPLERGIIPIFKMTILPSDDSKELGNTSSLSGGVTVIMIRTRTFFLLF